VVHENTPNLRGFQALEMAIKIRLWFDACFYLSRNFVSLKISVDIIMSSATAILTSLSDLTNNPKLDHYDPHLCKDIHIKLDKEARDQGLSYEERFEMVKITS
jgi:hypothetical protein